MILLGTVTLGIMRLGWMNTRRIVSVCERAGNMEVGGECGAQVGWSSSHRHRRVRALSQSRTSIELITAHCTHGVRKANGDPAAGSSDVDVTPAHPPR